jgi:regulator of sigma E protease
MMTLLLFLIIFMVVVVAHEFGHFITAKRNGIHVVEFSVGMGPMIAHFDRGGTCYAIRLLPLGGACIFEGEDQITNPAATKDPSEPLEMQSDEEEEKGKYGISFLKAGVWARIATVFAGPLFNMILGFLVALILVSYNGSDRPVVGQIMENSAAEEAGMQSGDVITRINGERIHLYREVSLISALNSKGNPLALEYERDGVKYSTTLVPRFSTEDNRYYMGIQGGAEIVDVKGLQVFQYAFYETGYVLKATLKSLQMLVMGQLSKNDVSGPVGIAHVVGDSYQEVKAYGPVAVFMRMINLILIISVNLGVMNLLPLPALDGGRLVFLFVEVLRGKPVPPEKESIVHFVGLMLFLLLSVFVMYNDIMNYFIK